jgi:hypothetical protein
MKRGLCILLALFGCRQAKTQSAPKDAIVETRDGNFATWPDPQNIPVCWVDNKIVRQDFKDEVKRFVTEEYARADLAFSGWDLCTGQEDNVIKIKIITDNVEKGSSSGRFGIFKLGEGIMYLNHRVHWDPINNKSVPWRERNPFTGEVGPGCPSNEGMNCVRQDAIHEFGHAVGMHHEMNRPDGTCPLAQTAHMASTAEMATFVGEYDKDSIMDYCKNIIDNIEDNVPHLSESDVKALKTYYFSPIVRVDFKGGEWFYFTGNNATHYRYKMGPLDQTDCSDENGYSEPALLDNGNGGQQGIRAPHQTGKFKVCAIGGKGDVWQAFDMASRKLVDL